MYMLIIQRVPGMNPTVVTSDDIGFLRNVLEEAKGEMLPPSPLSAPDSQCKHAVVRGQIVSIKLVHEDYTPDEWGKPVTIEGSYGPGPTEKISVTLTKPSKVKPSKVKPRFL